MLEQANLPVDQLASLLAMQWRAQRAGYAQMHPAAVEHVIEVDGSRVGHVLLEWPDAASGTAEVRIVDLALLPDWTGRGIGSTVIGEIVDEAGSRGCSVTLAVARDNRPARALYQRLGFADESGSSTSTHLALRHP